MANVKNHHIKIAVFLFCLLQAQGFAKLLPEKTDNSFEEFFKELRMMINRIADKVQLRLNESDIRVHDYFEKLKVNMDVTNEQFQEFVKKFEKDMQENYVQICEFIPKQINRLSEEIKARDPELAEKIKKLKEDFTHLKEELMKLIEDIKKPALAHYNELKEEVIAKSKPIVKRWTPAIKNVEEIILQLIPDKKNDAKKN